MAISQSVTQLNRALGSARARHGGDWVVCLGAISVFVPWRTCREDLRHRFRFGWARFRRWAYGSGTADRTTTERLRTQRPYSSTAGAGEHLVEGGLLTIVGISMTEELG